MPVKPNILLAALLLAGTIAHAQVLTPSKPPPSSNTGGSGNSSSPSRGSGPSGGSGSGQSLGSDIPFFDPGTETFTWDGHTWNVNDNRLFGARFEKYLSAPEALSAIDEEYRQTIDRILGFLSPKNPGGPNLYDAVGLLPTASNYYNDARLCDSLMNAIYGISLGQNNVAALSKMNEAMEKELREVRGHYEYEVDVRRPAAEPKPQSQPVGGQGRGQGQQQQNPNQNQGISSTVQDATVAGGYVKRVAELEAMKIANQTQMATSTLQSKIEFQALIVQFFMQRRFEHVVMGCRFYRKLFSDGDNKMQFKEGSDIEKSFGQTLGFNPTVSTMETIANEIIRDVDEGVEAFYFLLSKTELESATKRLSESFVAGEYLPKIRTLKRSDKEKVLQFVRDSNQLISAIEVRDYALAETLVTRMREMARDFDYSKPLAAIETAKRISEMRIRKAKNAAMAGDTAEYEENLRVATEIWPTNPSLAKEFDLIADQADVKNMALVELDRLISTKSYRQIYEDQARYIAASIGDKEREQQLKDVLTNIQKIDIAITQAEKLAERGDPHGAWETVEEFFVDSPDDAKLNAVRSDLATGVAEFVSALKKAERLEERDQNGSSLAWYLKARKMYPNSVYAKRGIGRLVDEILPNDGAAGAADKGEGGTF